jgi:hypothetical protein
MNETHDQPVSQLIPATLARPMILAPEAWQWAVSEGWSGTRRALNKQADNFVNYHLRSTNTPNVWRRMWKAWVLRAMEQGLDRPAKERRPKYNSVTRRFQEDVLDLLSHRMGWRGRDWDALDFARARAALHKIRQAHPDCRPDDIIAFLLFVKQNWVTQGLPHIADHVAKWDVFWNSRARWAALRSG